MNTLASLLAEYFADWGWTWKVGGKDKVPDEDDLKRALDHAATVLYAEPVGSRLEVGRLIITKTHNGFDTYVFVGTYL